jgi:hypothetical protein
MKDINELKDYRLKYKRYYGIEFNSDYAIHHIDFNHNNNDISNLLLLPKDLHNRYHQLVNELGGVDEHGNIKFNALINMCVSNYAAPIIEELGATIKAINKWVLYKHNLEMQKVIKREV